MTGPINMTPRVTLPPPPTGTELIATKKAGLCFLTERVPGGVEPPGTPSSRRRGGIQHLPFTVAPTEQVGGVGGGV